MRIEHDRVKIIFASGKVIELTQAEYEELKNEFNKKECCPFPTSPKDDNYKKWVKPAELIVVAWKEFNTGGIPFFNTTVDNCMVY